MSSDQTYEQEWRDREKRMMARAEQLVGVTAAIKLDGRRSGIMDCPVCQAALHFRVSSNGHQRARCATPKCINFIQ